MVFFTCNACGQAVKKNQVEKHYTTKCRNCTILSCIDCGKEFCGDEYQGHVKCVTENEKYGAKDTKDVKPKPSSTKGEAKQVNWIENIKNYIAVTNLPHRISSLLNDLLKYNNIPRKKQAFQNFLSNSVRIRDKNLSEEIWEIFMKANQSEGSSKATEKKDDAEVEPKSDQPELDNGNISHADTCPTETIKHKKKKRKDKNDEMQKTEDNEPADKQEAMKKHKRKHKEVEQQEEEENIVTGELVEETARHETTDRKSNKLKHKKNKQEEHAEEQENRLVNSEVIEDAFTNGNTIKKHKKKKRKSEVDAVSAEIDHDAKDNTSQNSHDTENGRAQDCTVETTGMIKTSKKKKNKKHKKHDNLTDNMTNGDESVAMEEKELKQKKAKRKSDENHADKTNSIEKTAENTECHAEGENLYKKKKKKCK